jgi:hypothetical protein
MKKIYILISALFLLPLYLLSQCPETFHDFSAVNIKGTEISLSDFAGKKVLVVNTASN